MSLLKLKTIIFLTLFTVISGCSDEPYEKYLGYWQKNDIETVSITYISRDGDTYLLLSDVFRETDFFGNKRKPITLNASEGKLSEGGGLLNASLGLSSDGNTLYRADSDYTRLSKFEFETLKSSLGVN